MEIDLCMSANDQLSRAMLSSVLGRKVFCLFSFSLVGEKEGVHERREGRQGFWERLVDRRVSGREFVRGYLFWGGSANLA